MAPDETPRTSPEVAGRFAVVTVRMGDDLYEHLLGPVRDDPEAMATMWFEAENRLDEAPSTGWYIVVVDGQAATWIAVDREGGRLRLHDHYERPGYRGHGLYARLVVHVHEQVARSRLPAYTYVFETPMRALRALGWVVADEGDSDEPGVDSHNWWRMEWTPPRATSS
jgi:hypothetical protein